MIASGIKKNIPTLILIGSALMMSSCATTTTSESSANKPAETVSTKIENTKVDTPVTNENQQTTASAQVKEVESVKTTTSTAQNSDETSMQNISKVSSNQKLVNVRTAPTTKSRVVAVLKGGHSIEILETTDAWVKIKWHKGQSVKQGWMSKRFVEGYEL